MYQQVKNLTEQEKIVDHAFSRQSSHFDKIESQNEILKEMRERIRNKVLRLLQPKSHILELNAGTGLDAVFFAEAGHKVLATDGAKGMVAELEKKVHKAGLADKIEPRQLSYFNLHELPDAQYDLVFSNFGGLNCAPSLEKIFTNFPRLLKPGGYVVLVLMPKICPWELTYLLRGKKELALRRLQKNGALSHLEGVKFTTWYYSPKQVKEALPPGFRQIALTGMGSVMPPPYMEKFPQKWPRLFNVLKKLDKSLQNVSPFNTWADHYILVMQYIGDGSN